MRPTLAVLLLGIASPTCTALRLARLASVVARPRTATLLLLSASEDSSSNVETAAAGVDVSEATKKVKKLLGADELSGSLDAIMLPGGDESYLNDRPQMLGTVSSSELLTLDEKADFWPTDLEPGYSDAKQMLFVDEISCTGCAWCPHVARSTFDTKASEYGKARVFQQGEDVIDALEEAIDVCPAECMHWVTREELEILEEHRELHLESMQAEDWRFGGNADWREPLRSDGWRRTENCRQSGKGGESSF